MDQSAEPVAGVAVTARFTCQGSTSGPHRRTLCLCSSFRFRRCLAAPRIRITVPLLDLLFVLAQLLFQPMNHRIHRTHQIVRLIVRHEIVLVLGRHLGVDPRRIRIGQIDDDFDRRQPIEYPQSASPPGPRSSLATRRSNDHDAWKSVSARICSPGARSRLLSSSVRRGEIMPAATNQSF